MLVVGEDIQSTGSMKEDNNGASYELRRGRSSVTKAPAGKRRVDEQTALILGGRQNRPRYIGSAINDISEGGVSGCTGGAQGRRHG